MKATRTLLLAPALLLALAGRIRAAEPDTNGAEFFEKRIRPILSEHCYQCHSDAAQKAKKLKGDLLLDSTTGMKKGGDNGPAFMPGKPSESLIIKALRHDELRMPPKGKLPDAVIADFETWIKMGAPLPSATASVAKSAIIDWTKARQFWSFVPPVKQARPSVQNAPWPRSDIDFHILAAMEKRGLQPVRMATKQELLRRATFDLTGLPTTPEELDAFLKDDSKEAFSRVIDRLLASPRYGERWGRHWLDVARYAEDQAHTFAAKAYTNAYRYRDWVINAFNDDMPYDRFVRLQMAADLLLTDDAERVKHMPALGFFGLGAQYYKDNTEIVKALADELDERIDTMGRGLLGITVACARCHDHKFDPVPTQDYYSLAGIFNSSKLTDIPLATADEVKKYQEAARLAREADDKLKQAIRVERGLAFMRWYVGEKAIFHLPEAQLIAKLPAERKQQLDRMQQEVARLRKEAPDKMETKFAVAHAMSEGTGADMKVYQRGDPRNQGEVVPRRFLRVLAGDDPPKFNQGSGRKQLAEAIATKDNPLTARVIVNRVWAWHFGRGIVGTPSNFGELGERPTHPELLDDLACRFIENAWSLKWLHREIMRSATYQLSSDDNEKNESIDGDNKYHWRMSRRRLDVESWRDALLFVSGKLDTTMGGPTTDLNSTSNLRRTVYAKISRHELNALLRLFDFPDANITSEKRTETTVPQQQLFVLNSAFVAERAKALAARVQVEAKDDAARVRLAFLLAFSRPASDADVQLAIRFLSAEDGAEEKAKTKLTHWERLCQALLGSNEFMYID